MRRLSMDGSGYFPCIFAPVARRLCLQIQANINVSALRAANSSLVKLVVLVQGIISFTWWMLIASPALAYRHNA
eukprot:scaffold408210_cov15-Prasinocladus_malaysianus.AAC.1